MTSIENKSDNPTEIKLISKDDIIKQYQDQLDRLMISHEEIRSRQSLIVASIAETSRILIALGGQGFSPPPGLPESSVINFSQAIREAIHTMDGEFTKNDIINRINIMHPDCVGLKPGSIGSIICQYSKAGTYLKVVSKGHQGTLSVYTRIKNDSPQ